jgi:hypothetical protein
LRGHILVEKEAKEKTFERKKMRIKVSLMLCSIEQAWLTKRHSLLALSKSKGKSKIFLTS